MVEPTPGSSPLGKLIARGALLGVLAPAVYLTLNQAFGLAGALFRTGALPDFPRPASQAALYIVAALLLAGPGGVVGLLVALQVGVLSRTFGRPALWGPLVGAIAGAALGAVSLAEGLAKSGAPTYGWTLGGLASDVLLPGLLGGLAGRLCVQGVGLARTASGALRLWSVPIALANLAALAVTAWLLVPWSAMLPPKPPADVTPLPPAVARSLCAGLKIPSGDWRCDPSATVRVMDLAPELEEAVLAAADMDGVQALLGPYRRACKDVAWSRRGVEYSECVYDLPGDGTSDVTVGFNAAGQPRWVFFASETG